MVFEPEDGSLDREVDSSMEMFKRSQVGPSATISIIQPARVLLVLDGSPQDATSTESAKFLRAQHDVETLILDAREPTGEDLQDIVSPIVGQISGSRPIHPQPPDGVEGRESYEQILSTLESHQLDLVIVPSPYGRSFDKVGVDSVGTVLDVLLGRCPIPLLVTRRDDKRLEKAIGQMRMIVGGECDAELRAAAWMFGLARDDSRLSLNLVVEREHYENLRALVTALSPDASLSEKQLSDALAKSHQALHGSMMKTSNDRGLSYELIPQAGEEAPPNPLGDSSDQLLVMPLEVDDRFAQGFVHDRLRRSPHPVLIIPSHVPTTA